MIGSAPGGKGSVYTFQSTLAELRISKLACGSIAATAALNLRKRQGFNNDSTMCFKRMFNYRLASLRIVIVFVVLSCRTVLRFDNQCCENIRS